MEDHQVTQKLSKISKGAQKLENFHSRPKTGPIGPIYLVHWLIGLPGIQERYYQDMQKSSKPKPKNAKMTRGNFHR